MITQTDIINTTYCTIDGLSGDSDYVIKVAAYTSSGIGPWSSEFRGKTLRTPRNGDYPMILWSAAEGLLQSDVTGDEVENLVSAENMKVEIINFSLNYTKNDFYVGCKRAVPHY